MEVNMMYRTIQNNSGLKMEEYKAPTLHCDPKKQILDREYSDYKNKPSQRKFKVTCKHKGFYLDEEIAPLVQNPAPGLYKSKSSFNFQKQKRHKSADLKKVDRKIKKGTYIDEIQQYHKKFKEPGVSKYNLLKEPFKKKPSSFKKKQKEEKIHVLDNVKTLAAQVPGVGFYNPHKSVPHLKVNRNDYKFFKKKDEAQQKKLKKSLSAKMSPFTYTPIEPDTFSWVKKNNKRERSRWSHGKIDLRKGAQSQMKSPSPAEYQTINHWSSGSGKGFGVGKVKLYERLTKTARPHSVYN